jgi:TolA-binding protein
MTRSAESSSSGSALSQIEERTSRDAEAAARAPQAGALFAKRDSQASAAAPAAAPAPQPAVKPAPAPAPKAVAPPAAASAPAPAAAPAQVAKLQGETPEREFERIAQLRAEGRHEEADKAFLEFRRRYPGFRITEEMLKRIERPQGAR